MKYKDDPEKQKRVEAFRRSNDFERARVKIANACLHPTTIPPWPTPRFLTLDLEQLIARDMSERPLHGVPSVYRTEDVSLQNIIKEQLERADAALAVHPRRETTFLSPADRIALTRRLADDDTTPANLRVYAARQRRHRLYVWRAA
jgi:hypothetical protein